MEERFSASNLRKELREMVIGESRTIEIPEPRIVSVRKFMSNSDSFGKGRNYEWSIAGNDLRIKRLWDSIQDKWGMHAFERGVPYLFRVDPRDYPSIRSTAALLRRKMGIIIRCRVQDQGMSAMVSGFDDMPDRARPIAEKMKVPVNEFYVSEAVRRKEGRPLKFPIDKLEVNESLFVSHEEEHRPTNLRVFCHYHGQRLERKFSVLRTAGGHRITRTT